MTAEDTRDMGLLEELALNIENETDPLKAAKLNARLAVRQDKFRRQEHKEVMECIEDMAKAINGDGDIKEGLNYKVIKNTEDVATIKKFGSVAGVATLLWILNGIFDIL